MMGQSRRQQQHENQQHHTKMVVGLLVLSLVQLSLDVGGLFSLSPVEAFSPPTPSIGSPLRRSSITTTATTRRNLSENNNPSNDSQPSSGGEGGIKFSRPEINSVTNLDETIDQKRDQTNTEVVAAAATSTVNERLLAELKEVEQKEKYGVSRSTSVGAKMGFSSVDGYGRRRKSDEEIQAAIEAARDLNGINPIVAIVGSIFALGVAAGLWYGTNQLGTFFALHPIDDDAAYFVQRSSQVVRNVAIGIISLASGFFGVTGLGILGMGIRVSYGVMTGELDPTPIKTNQNQQVDTVDSMPNVWDLMTNKKPGRKR